jgi:uncharacterized protein DUF6600
MRTLRIVLLALLLGSFAGAALAQTSVSAGIHIGPSGRASVDLGFFYDDLASYGNWIERPSYGWVWTPRSVSTSWQPYQDGHWVWTDQGWTWVTDEPYGWATYHYGRWYDDPEIGWAWVPGDEWGPAWVSWQEGSDYIGWAPLSPSVTVSFGGVLSVSLSPESYVFVPERYFLAPRINTYIVPRERVVNIYRETRNITVYRQVNNYVYNTGVPVDRIQRVVGRPVPRYQIADARSAQGTRVQGNRVAIFRPQVQRGANIQPPPSRPVARRAVVSATQFQQNHPDRAARRAAAQGTSAPGAQPTPAPRPGRQPRAGQTPPAEQGQPADQARPRGRHQAPQPEAAPPGRQHQVQPPPGQTERQRPPRQERPQVQDQEKRQPRNQPPPGQAQPKQERQRQPPPPQQRQKQQRQEEKKKEKQQEERKPPQS